MTTAVTLRVWRGDSARGGLPDFQVPAEGGEGVLHVIRDHPENKAAFAGPRLFVRYAALEMHPLDTNDRRQLLQERMGLGMCNITKCCTEVCPEGIHITDNAIIPLKERVVDLRYDPVWKTFRRLFRLRDPASSAGP